MQFEAIIKGGSFDANKVTCKLEYESDADITSGLSSLLEQKLQATIGMMEPFNARLEKGSYGVEKSTVNMIIDKGDSIIGELSRIAKSEEEVEIVLHKPQKDMFSVEYQLEKRDVLKQAENLLGKMDAQIQAQKPTMELTVIDGIEYYNGKRYGDLTPEEKAIVNGVGG